MPSIVNRVGVVEDFAAGGGSTPPVDSDGNPIETKSNPVTSTDNPDKSGKSKPARKR